MDSSQTTRYQRRAGAGAVTIAVHLLILWGLLFGGWTKQIVQLAKPLQIALINEIAAERAETPPAPPTFVAPATLTVKMPEVVIAPPDVAAATEVASALPSPSASSGSVMLPRPDPRRPWNQPAYTDKPGSVLLHLTVDDKGKIIGATVAQGSGNKRLDDLTVKEALRSWQLLPGTVDGKAVAMEVPWKVNYRLKTPPPAKTVARANDKPNCVAWGQVKNMFLVDDETVVVSVGADKYKRLDLRQCAGLTKAGDLSYSASASATLCESDTLPLKSAPAACAVAAIVEVDASEAEALRAPRENTLAQLSAEDIQKEMANRCAAQRRPRNAAAFDPNAFDKFLGSYQIDLDVFVTVTRDADRYFFRVTNEKAVEVFPENATTFFAKLVPAQISFERDARGAVVDLTLHRQGGEIIAKRVNEATATASEAALQKRMRLGKYDPERSELLLKYLTGEQRDVIPTDVLSPWLLPHVRQAWPAIQKANRRLGPLKALNFNRVNERGEDMYVAVHEKGRVLWAVGSLTADHKLLTLTGAEGIVSNRAVDPCSEKALENPGSYRPGRPGER